MGIAVVLGALYALVVGFLSTRRNFGKRVAMVETVENSGSTAVPKIKFRCSPPLDIDVEGTQEDLAAIEARVLALAEKGAGTIEVFGVTTGSPAPYQIWLQRLVIVVGVGRLLVSIGSNRELEITGSANNLKILATYFAFPTGVPGGEHNHLEYHPGDEWIAKNSIPIVISVKGLQS